MTAATTAKHTHDTPTEGHLIRWAKHYDRVMAIFTLGREGRLRRRTVDAAGLQPGQHVLDVGCGTGTLALAAADRVGPEGRVVGIDPSAAMIECASAKAPGRSEVRFQIAAIEQLPFDDHSFDAVLSSLMFHHLPSPLQRAGLLELLRVLRPGGRLTIVDVEGGGPPLHRLMQRVLGRGHSHDPRHGQSARDHEPHHDLRRVAELASELGFAEVHIEPFEPRFLRLLTALAPR